MTDEPMVAGKPESESAPWQSLDALQRRVLGVLVEKAKTTPDSYPLTVSSIKTACNQKSNRKPLMDLDADDVMATLDELREMGAVAEVQGDGRVSKYRHRAYEWLGVDKWELAVITELLLRGEQTVGDLRGRAARMEPIDNLAALQPILDRLLEKNLLVNLTPPGRGQIVTHALYQDGEQPTEATVDVAEARSEAPAGSAGRSSSSELSELRQTVAELTRRVELLEERLSDQA